MRNNVAKGAADQSGATSVEYALLAGLIAVGMILGASTLGNAVSERFEAAALALDAEADGDTTDEANGAMNEDKGKGKGKGKKN